MFHDDARATERPSRRTSAAANKYSIDDWNSDISSYEVLPSYLELEMAAAAALARYVEPEEERKPGKRSVLSRLSQAEKIIATGIAVIALSSVALISNGHYIEAKTEFSQAFLQRTSEPEIRRDGPTPSNGNELMSDADADMMQSRPQHAVMPAATSGETSALPGTL